MLAPFVSTAPTRANPMRTPEPAAAIGPKAMPRPRIPVSGQTDPSDCEVEKAWPPPYATPSQSTSIAPTASSAATGPGRHSAAGLVRRSTVSAAVTTRAMPTRPMASHGRTSWPRDTSNTVAIHSQAPHRNAARP